MNTSIGKFVGEKNREKRMNIMMAGVKLSCYFLFPKLWKDDILDDFGFEQEKV